jgi:tripartite-type tricarboxylate transporter receptor subunit TctC
MGPKKLKRATRWLLLAGFAFAAPGMQAKAETYPTRPVIIVVPFAAGGPTDVIARILADRMGTSLGQSVIIENVAGAAGSVGVGRVARSQADGHALSIGHWGTHVVNGAVYKLQYDVLGDFEPVALLPSNPYLILTKIDLPATDLQSLIAWLKVNPEKATTATGGMASAGHLIGLSFQKATGTKFAFVPYRGAHRPPVRSGCQLVVTRCGRADQSPRRDSKEPLGRCTGHTYGRRSGTARLPCCHLARPVGAKGHAEGDHCQAQRSGH